MRRLRSIPIKIDLLSYFYPSSLEEYEGIELITKSYEARLIIFTHICLAMIFTIVGIIFSVNLGYTTPTAILIACILILLTCSFVLYTVKGNKILFTIMMLIIIYVQFTTRSFGLKSHAWVLLPTLFYIYTVVSHTIGPRLAIGGFLVSSGAILYNYFFGGLGTPYLNTKWQFIVNFAIPMSFYLLVNYYRERIEKKKLLEIRKYQKRDTISKMIITLAHELNNPLTISKLCLDKIKTDPSEIHINRCEEGLDRITKISNFINDIQDFEEIDYGPNSKMYDLFKEIKFDEEGSK